VPHQDRDGEVCHQLGEGFPEANALAAEEGSESHRMAGATIRSLEPLGSGVKSIWDPLRRFFPLIRVMMNAIHVDVYGLAFGNFDSTKYHILSKALERRNGYGWLDSESLKEALAKEFQIFTHVTIELSDDIV